MRRGPLSLIAAAVLLAACSDGATTRSTQPAPSADTPAANADAPEALQLRAPLVGGGTVDLTSFAGTTVALWFWAPT